MGEYGLDEVQDKLLARQIQKDVQRLMECRKEMRRLFVEKAERFYNSPNRRFVRFVRRCLRLHVTDYKTYMQCIDYLATKTWGKG